MTTVTGTGTGTMAKGDLASTIAKHDADIKDLGGRIDGVESGLNTLKGEVHIGFGNVHKEFGGVTKVLAGLDKKIDQLSVRQGPGLYENVRAVAAGGAVVGMTATAITFLVQALNSPAITRLEAGHASVQRREQDEHAELKELRRERSTQAAEQVKELREGVSYLKTVVEELKARVAWAPTKIEVRR
jgi:hypothetical protein